MGIAFFDLDRTLLAINSGALWVRRELEQRHITKLQAARAGLWMLRYQLGFASVTQALRTAIQHLKGHSESDIRSRTERFYDQEVKGLYRRGGHRAVDFHRRRGDRLVLLTASSLYLAELTMRDLRLDAVLCNRFEVDERGLHTGKSLGTLCFGEGKLEHATRYAKEAGIPLSACWFYTDSYSDLPVLQAVGHPVAVNPDGRLKREAQRKGWEIVEWGGPGKDADLAQT